MRIAIIHDWLVTYAGAERVLEQMLAVFPEADLFSLIDYLPDNERKHILNKSVKTSYIQKLPFSRKKYRSYLPVMPHAIQKLDVSAYDVVISSSHAVAKGIVTQQNQLHVCMCYSPIRYAWDLRQQYLQETGLDSGIKGLLVNWVLDRIKNWDIKTSQRVDYFIAISEYIRQRISRAYGRDSEVIYPPVDVERFRLSEQKENFYLTASRMVPYKKISMIIETFAAMPDKKLVVIGDGPELDKCQRVARDNVELLGYQPFEILHDYMRRAKAFVFAAEEDFGITPLEAQACGTPVIAYGKGGALETIRGNIENEPTGMFYDEQTVDSLAQGIQAFEANVSRFHPLNCRKNAERFSIPRFRSEFKAYMQEKIRAHAAKT